MRRILSRVDKAMRNPGHAARRVLQSVKGYAARRKFLPLVKEAVDSRGTPAHKLIQSQAGIAYGLQSADQQQILEAKEFVWNTVLVMKHLYEKGFRFNFGVCSLGFHGLSCICSSRNEMEAAVYLYGFYPPVNLFCTYHLFLSKGSFALDVGGNLGLHALAMATAVGQDGLIYTYEPRKELVEKLKKNLAVNSMTERVSIRNTAVGRERGFVPFSDEADNFNEGLGHFDRDSEHSIEITSLDEDTGEQTRSLSLIKIDVEGMELEVLAGAQRILEQHKPALVIEYKETSPPKWNLNRLREYLPYAIQVYGIPRRVGNLTPANENEKFPGCDDILVVSAEHVIIVGAHLDFLHP